MTSAIATRPRHGPLRRSVLDFSDYLELRRMRDAGVADAEVERRLRFLEAALPVPFADAIPHLVTLADAPAPPPRDLTRDALRVVFAMREEFARHGTTRAGMMGFDLPEGRGLKDWLDFIEEERKQSMQVRRLLREVDRKVYAVYTGVRKMPVARLPDESG